MVFHHSFPKDKYYVLPTNTESKPGSKWSDSKCNTSVREYETFYINNTWKKNLSTNWKIMLELLIVPKIDRVFRIGMSHNSISKLNLAKLTRGIADIWCVTLIHSLPIPRASLHSLQAKTLPQFSSLGISLLIISENYTLVTLHTQSVTGCSHAPPPNSIWIWKI